MLLTRLEIMRAQPTATGAAAPGFDVVGEALNAQTERR
jgi:hypothetical protein